jgi:hypothetical protein
MTSQSLGARKNGAEEAISRVCVRSKRRVTFVQRRITIQKIVE